MESKKTILIADDDVDFLLQMKINVEKMGFQVITADTQKAAEKLIEEHKPDLAIFDLMMENEDSGFILSYKLKKKYSDVPVIIATAVTATTGISFDDKNPNVQSWIKADLLLEKGIRPEQLHREIVRLLNI